MSSDARTGKARPAPRPVLTWVPSDDPGPIALLLSWADHLGYLGPDHRRGCVWTPRAFDAPEEWRRVLCFHHLDLPLSIDRHEPVSHPRLPWSPWGTKSGPNFQFFRLLDWFVRSHDDEWLLAVEPDTFPMGTSVAPTVHALLDAHPDAWMIGGQPHPATRPLLAADLWNHLNGAALYRVASSSFADFRTQVWVPSLLSVLKEEPTYAFDCLTDPKAQTHLPGALMDAWSQASDRFVATAGIVNASTLTIEPGQISALVAEPETAAALRDEATTPWLMHAKGLPIDTAPLNSIDKRAVPARPRPPAMQYKAAWGPMIPPLAAAIASSDRTVTFLHLPKTGGSSLTKTINSAPDWLMLRFPLSTVAASACSCGSPLCLEHHQRAQVRQVSRETVGGRHLFVKLGHEAYEAVEWMRARLEPSGGSLDEVLMAVRPARARLVSMFRDYWTQVAAADGLGLGAQEAPAHVARIARGYKADSVHYVRPDGSIDGRAWFTAFGIHGGGVPFFLSDAFRDPEHLDSEITAGRLSPIPTAEMDPTLTALTGVAEPSRTRVSNPAAAEAVATAIEDAADLIDELAARDAEYDAVLIDALGERRFLGSPR